MVSNYHNNPELLALLKEVAGYKMSPEERLQQRVSWVYGNMPHDSEITRDEIERRLRDVYPS